MKSEKNILINLLAMCCFLIFIGRGYEYLFWNGPYRVLFWDEDLMSPILLTLFDWQWMDYATDLRVNQYIDLYTKSIGLIFVLCSASVVFRLYLPKWISRTILFIGCWFLLVHSLLATKDYFYHVGMWFEFGIQVGTPILFIMVMSNKISTHRILTCCKLITALTFAAHGSYAIGLYPIPGHFIEMTMGILGVSETSAVLFLKVVGTMDFIVAIGLFIPAIMRPVLIYAFIWGFITATARAYYGFDLRWPMSSLHQYMYMTVYRLPHGLIPLAVFTHYFYPIFLKSKKPAYGS